MLLGSLVYFVKSRTSMYLFKSLTIGIRSKIMKKLMWDLLYPWTMFEGYLDQYFCGWFKFSLSYLQWHSYRVYSIFGAVLVNFVAALCRGFHRVQSDQRGSESEAGAARSLHDHRRRLAEFGRPVAQRQQLRLQCGDVTTVGGLRRTAGAGHDYGRHTGGGCAAALDNRLRHAGNGSRPGGHRDCGGGAERRHFGHCAQPPILRFLYF